MAAFIYKMRLRKVFNLSQKLLMILFSKFRSDFQLRMISTVSGIEHNFNLLKIQYLNKYF